MRSKGFRRRTKIVATIGPASRSPETIRALLEAGADVFRLNFAHDSFEVHARAAARAREVAAEVGRRVGILVDLPGPKMRTGPMRGETFLHPGAQFVLTSEDVEGDERRASTSVPDLPELVAEGDEIFLADGEIVLRVTGVAGDDVVTEIVRGGVLRSRKGMHLPAAEHRLSAFTGEETKALQRAVELGADAIGLSFVRTEKDVATARAALPDTEDRALLVAKIETRSALENLDAIVGASDAVMIARGDLGIQTPLRRVPLLQKQIIQTCNRTGVPAITATQMLESMTRAPLPTRAEVGDVANAVLDGTDALMLSEETAVGDHPALVVRTMAEIASAAEDEPRHELEPGGDAMKEEPVSWAVAHAAVEAAEDLAVAAILCPTRSGATARRVAAFRPSVPVVAIASGARVLGGLHLVWGVTPLFAPDLPQADDTSQEVARAIAAAAHAGLVASGDLVTVVAGSPGPRAGRTDFMRVARA